MKKNTKSGFTLVEMLVSLAIFSFVLIMMSGMFGSFVKNYKASRDVQVTLEDAQQSIGTMMKNIRTSIIVSSNPQSVRIFNYSQADGFKCLQYSFVGQTLEYTVAIAAADPTMCSSTGTFSVPTEIISGRVTGAFDAVASSTGIVGKVTVAASLSQGTGSEVIPVQSTVSLRN